MLSVAVNRRQRVGCDGWLSGFGQGGRVRFVCGLAKKWKSVLTGFNPPIDLVIL